MGQIPIDKKYCKILGTKSDSMKQTYDTRDKTQDQNIKIPESAHSCNQTTYNISA